MLKFFKIWEMWFERWFENVKTYWVAKGLEELCTAYQSWTKFHVEFWTRRLLLNPLWWTTHLNCCYHPDRRDDENNNWLLSSMVVFIIIISLPGLSYFIGKLPFPEKDVLCLLQKWTKSQPEHAPKFSNFFSIGLCENWNQPDAICEDIFNCWWANGLRKLVWKISKIRQTKKIQGLSSLREIGEGSSRLGLKKHFHFIAAERNYILQGLNSN